MTRKLQVFISSTYNDLREERQAAVEAILKSGHIPAGMELFAAGDQSQMKTIERWIDESDVYMLILGGRYGSIEASSGVSYTELEFDYAVQAGKRLFSVVMADTTLEERVKANGVQAIEQDNPVQLKQFRKKVLENISAFFTDRKDIKLAVHESMSDFTLDLALKGWVSGREIDTVTGLQDDLRRVREENVRLSEQVSTLEAQQKSSHSADSPAGSVQFAEDEISDIISILDSIEVVVPENVRPEGSPPKGSLLGILDMNRDPLVSGVTNRANSNDTIRFLYFNVLPKLQVYGLAENQAISGVTYRRSVLTDKGLKVLAALDRKRLKNKEKK